MKNFFTLQKFSQYNPQHQILIQSKDRDKNLIFLIVFTDPDSQYPNHLQYKSIHAPSKDMAILQLQQKYPSAQIKEVQRRITKLIVQKGAKPRAAGSLWEGQLNEYQAKRLNNVDQKKLRTDMNRSLNQK